jgi:hypothetical protein
MSTEKKIRAVVRSLIDFKKSKILYTINHPSMVAGLWGCITRYGIEYIASNHEIVVDEVQDKLMDGADIEYEWTEEQYEAFVKFNPNLLTQKFF